MSRLLNLIATERPDAVHVWSGGEVVVDASIATDVVNRAESLGIALLGMEGFLVDDDSGAVYPSLARISDYGLPIVSDRDRSFAEPVETPEQRYKSGHLHLLLAIT